VSDFYEPEMADPGDGDMFGAFEAAVLRACPATREAVREHEDETGEPCPICDRDCLYHEPERWPK
jgi:hypothetical protein